MHTINTSYNDVTDNEVIVVAALLWLIRQGLPRQGATVDALAVYISRKGRARLDG